MWENFKTIFPSFLVHLAVMVVLFSVVWWSVKNFFSDRPTPWLSIAALAFCTSAYAHLNTMTGIYQNILIQERNAELQKTNNDTVAQEEFKQREKVLSNVNAILQKPELANEENKAKLAQAFPIVFNDQRIKKVYFENIASLLQCRGAMTNDLLAANDKKEAVQSELTAKCFQAKGQFFGRDTLIEKGEVEKHAELLAHFASKRQVASAKEMPTVENLKTQIQVLSAGLEAMKFIFN